jgi:hypothetical protein
MMQDFEQLHTKLSTFASHYVHFLLIGCARAKEVGRTVLDGEKNPGKPEWRGNAV